MKGVMGLTTAVALGVVGALCNYLYLAQKARDLEKEEFIGIAEGDGINPGQKFKDSDLIPISIPRPSVGNLEKAAYKYADKNTLVGMTATRSYHPGDIILRQDLRTPPQTDPKKLLAANEVLMSVPIDTRVFVSSYVSGGDFVYFMVPRIASTGGPLPPPSEGELVPQPAPTSTGAEVLGPFRVLAVGNRLGSAEVLRAAGGNTTQENVISVAVEADKNGVPTGIGAKLLDMLRLTNFQPVQVLLPKGKEK